MIPKCEKCERIMHDPRKGCQRCKEDVRRQKIHQSPWAQEEGGYLPLSKLLAYRSSSEIGAVLNLDRNTANQWARRGKMFTPEQACYAAELLGLNPFSVWPELETNVGPPDAAWRDQRACADTPTEWFFPRKGVGRPRLDRPQKTTFDPYGMVRPICKSCPVRHACLWDGMRIEPSQGRFGMFGGLTPEERARLAKLFNWRPRVHVA